MFAIPENTKAILFDLGGVLIDLHLQKTYDAFAKLGFPGFDRHFDSFSGSPFIEQFEEGTCSPEKFIGRLKEYCNPGTGTGSIITAWNAMLGTFSPRKLEAVQELKKKYRVLLYSNTNILHVNYLEIYYKQQFGESVFVNSFHKIYYSHILRIRKPHPEGFKKILAEQGLQPNDVFYIDDGSMHIAAAKKLGLQTLLWKQNADFTEPSISEIS